MTTFRIIIEVQRPVPPTKQEANEAARLLAKYLRNYTYSAKVVKASVKKEKK